MTDKRHALLAQQVGLKGNFACFGPVECIHFVMLRP